MLEQPYKDRAEVRNHTVKDLRLRLYSFRQLIKIEDMNPGDSVDDLLDQIPK